MIRPGRKPGLLPNLLLVTLLVTAQFGSLLHAYEHDPGAPQGKVCSACTAASQLSSACVDTHGHDELMPFSCDIGMLFDTGFISTHSILVHQRGPPATL